MKLSQFDSATLLAGGKVRVTGPTGDARGGPQHHWDKSTPVHFAIVRDGHVLTGTGHWTGGKRWSGESDRAEPALTAGPASAFALEIRFWHDNEAGGFQTYAWSQDIELQ
jgi:hypothetical protein